MEIPYTIQRQIDTFQPIQVEGLTLHPVKVKDHGVFAACSHALAFAQRRLPVAMWSKPLLAAFFELDCQKLADGEPAAGLFAAVVTLIHMAVFPDESIEDSLGAGKLSILTDSAEPTKLRGIRVVSDDGEVLITPAKFQMIRRYIAAQNGVEIPPDGANPEILDADAEAMADQARDMDISTAHMITAVSALEHVSEAEIGEWALLRLDRHADAHRKILDYLLFGFAATQGAFRAGGNPVPHPWFPKKKDGTGSMIDAAGYLNGAARTAIEQQA